MTFQNQKEHCLNNILQKIKIILFVKIYFNVLNFCYLLLASFLSVNKFLNVFFFFLIILMFN